MLQIIIFQLAALLWATTALSKSTSIQMIGLIMAAIFAIWGIAQGASVSLVP